MLEYFRMVTSGVLPQSYSKGPRQKSVEGGDSSESEDNTVNKKVGRRRLLPEDRKRAIEKEKSKKPNRRILRDTLGFGSKTKLKEDLNLPRRPSSEFPDFGEGYKDTQSNKGEMMNLHLAGEDDDLYSGYGRRMFDPLNQAATKTHNAPEQLVKPNETPEEKIKVLERKISLLVEESCMAASRRENKIALDRAKDASAKERSLIRLREQAGLADSLHNVLFNLATQYENNDMFTEALNTYQVITKNRMFNNAGRLKVNMGNIYFKTGQFSKAIKYYRMALDQVPNTQKSLRIKIMHNIGILFVKMGQYTDACTSFEWIMSEQAKIVSIGQKVEDEDKYLPVNDDPMSHLILEAIKNDELRKLANDLEINKAVMFLKQKDFNQAIDTLKGFEKQDTKVASTAATNLSFLYFLQGEIDQAEKYATLARESDSYNAAAFVNLGNCCLRKNDVEKAKELYIIALENDASCVEALYNLSLCNKKLELYEDALEGFFKLHSIVRNYSQVVYQIANVYELMEDSDQATEWYLQLLGLVPTDPSILQKVGNIFDNEGDKQQAYQYHYDSYKNFPSSLDTIDWLGSYFIEMQVAEKAIVYFERAALMQPDEVKWHLMIASCYRRSGNYHRSLDTYRSIHRRFPDNIECLRFLVKISSDMGLKEAGDYAVELKKAERAKGLQEQRAMSSRPGSMRNSGRSRQGSAGGDLNSPGGSRTPSRGGNSAGSVPSRLALDEEESYSPKAKVLL
ncbi:intraflagellar transport protein 88 homolog [Eurytemora carolleeae]|uniref:intraflagellar transport protein 88 homolog n=1 Tax=Eurytemora carolleeae TaxID=1294199 RepID=UPI000C76832D|nr:intraflagellar transport protein 88 homolog [Eurytemora carolleeae]|eukprot:XP_023332128.1 intraflagellar transport protein 88 homolog [Eurytemora affinis]